MLRSILAIVVAAATWIVLATLLNLVVRFAWPAYAAVEQSMQFTLPMLLLRLLFGLIASFASGLIGARIARAAGNAAMYVFAALLLAMFVPVHYNLWSRFPVWYHLFFLASLVVFTVLGARSAAKLESATASAST
jgi:hypothetical protein